MSEEREMIEFNKLIDEENLKKQKLIDQQREDEELAKRLMQEELKWQEEEVMRKALEESLKDFRQNSSPNL